MAMPAKAAPARRVVVATAKAKIAPATPLEIAQSDWLTVPA
jgi:hypothetical protein